MKIISIKPLSVNNCWQGRRFKTPIYKGYEKELLLKPPKFDVPKVKLKLVIVFGFSNKLSDVDNGLKPFLDILQKKYNFDDRDIYQLNVTKEIVKKGSEFIGFNIYEL